MKESIVKYGNGITMADLEDEDKARELCKKHHIEIMKGWTLGHFITALFDELICSSQPLLPAILLLYHL